MNKRGQFFLIAALVIVGIILSVGAVYNSVKTQKEENKVYDLSTEIGFEGNKVLDSGVFNSLEQDEIDGNILNLANNYSSLNPDSELIIIYGDQNAVQYTCADQGSVCLSSTCSPVCNINPVSLPTEFDPETGRIVLRIPGSTTTYEFELKEGQTFYIVVKKEKGQDAFIATG